MTFGTTLVLLLHLVGCLYQFVSVMHSHTNIRVFVEVSKVEVGIDRVCQRSHTLKCE